MSSSSCCSTAGRCVKHQLAAVELPVPKRHKVAEVVKVLAAAAAEVEVVVEEEDVPPAIRQAKTTLLVQGRRVFRLQQESAQIEAQLQAEKDEFRRLVTVHDGKVTALHNASLANNTRVFDAQQRRMEAETALEVAEKRRAAQDRFWRCLLVFLHDGEVHVPCAKHRLVFHIACFEHPSDEPCVDACYSARRLDRCPGLFLFLLVSFSDGLWFDRVL